MSKHHKVSKTLMSSGLQPADTTVARRNSELYYDFLYGTCLFRDFNAQKLLGAFGSMNCHVGTNALNLPYIKVCRGVLRGFYLRHLLTETLLLAAGIDISPLQVNTSLISVLNNCSHHYSC